MIEFNSGYIIQIWYCGVETNPRYSRAGEKVTLYSSLKGSENMFPRYKSYNSLNAYSSNNEAPLGMINLDLYMLYRSRSHKNRSLCNI
jgi:hypothetical protein